MAKQTWMERAGVTAGKAILIAVLGVVLLGVVVSQFVSTADPKAAAAVDKKRPRSRPAARRPLKTRPVAETTATAPSSTDWRPWRSVSVDEVMCFNPLQAPAGMEIAVLDAVPSASESAQVDPAQLERQNELTRKRLQARQELLESGVRMIVVGTKGKTAYVGQQLVREGDVVDGFLVKTICADGVEFVDTHAQ